MDIVVRTPHGDADVSIVSHAPSTTLGDVVTAVTGQAVPRLVIVDDRTVGATVLLDDIRLLLGSVLMTEPTVSAVTSDADVEVIQITGHGAGRAMRLGPGRYRIGPGRRSSADELAMAPVEHVVFELVVAPTHAASRVTISADGSEVALDGSTVTSDEPWHQGPVTIGPRTFQLDNPASPELPRSLSMPETDGTVAFSRPPRRRSAPDRRPVVDAVRDSALAAPTLWERRPNDPDAFVLPIGVRGDRGDIVGADLGSDRAVAVTGSEQFREALARTLIVEAATLHGPADLDLVVLTNADRLPQWDWAKWLPHLRLDGRPAIWSSLHDIERWAEGAGGRTVLATTPWISSHLTMVVLDDAALWNRRDSPLRAIVSNPPADLRMIALCDDAAGAPAVCTTVISETDDGLARLLSFTRTDDGGTIRPALTEAAVAVRVARALAPLADVELPTPPAPPTRHVDQIEISEVIGAIEPDQVMARWAGEAPRSAVVIGQRDQHLVELPVADDVTVIVAPSLGEAFDLAATMLITQCVDRSPAALWIVPLMLERTSRSELLWQLPHATDPHDVDTPIEPQRLLARLRSVLAEPDGPARIVLVTEASSSSTASSDETWLATLADGVRATSDLAMVVVTDRSDTATTSGDTMIRIGHGDTSGAGARRVATVTARDGTSGPSFTPMQRDSTPTPQLELRPFVVGRALTPLERRVEQHWAQSDDVADRSLVRAATTIRDVATLWRGSESPQAWPERVVVPPAMPTRVDLDELLSDSPGDGVPLGLVDDPSSAGVRTRWWEPANGSLFVLGSRRSGVEQVLATIVLGIIDRFSTLDVRLVVVEHSSARRRALNSIDRAMRVVAPDHADEMADAIDEVAAELARRAAPSGPASPDGPHMVLVIGDLVHLRHHYADHALGARIDEVLTAASRAGSGIDVVAYVSEVAGAGPCATTMSSRLVGASSDHDELRKLGVEQPGDLEGVVGRCRSFPGGDLIQLAMPDATTESLLARRSIGDPR